MPSIDVDLFPGTDHDSSAPWSRVPDGRRGVEYKFGRDEALRDLLSSLVPLAEQHLRKLNGSSSAARPNVYAFIEFLEAHIERASAEVGYVADGLGI
jgi:hypothetical protein